MAEIEVNKTIFHVFMNFPKKFLIKSYLYLFNVAVFRIILVFLPILNIRSSTRHFSPAVAS